MFTANVPCVDNEPGCHGQAVCESFAHVNCYPFQPINEFGELYAEHGDWKVTGLWNAKKCKADSDDDGYTNGCVAPVVLVFAETLCPHVVDAKSPPATNWETLAASGILGTPQDWEEATSAP